MLLRARNLRPKILLLLVVLGLEAGLAAGTLRAAGGEPRPSGAASQEPSEATALAAGAVPAASLSAPPAAADALAVDEVAPPTAPAAETPQAATSPAAALVPAERLYLEPIIARAAHEHGLPADLLLAQAWAESSWKVDAVSNKGAVGVLQLMPSAVDFVSKRLLKLDQELDVLDPAANARMGARYMRHLIDRLDGDVRQALIAYNQGLAGLRRKGAVPAAVTYADRVLALRPVFAASA